MKIVINLHGWRPTTRADAFNFFQRKRSVSRRLLVADAQLALAMVQNLFAAAQHAADVGANLNMVFAHGLGMQQGVIADHVADFELGQFGLFCQMCNRVIAQVAEFILRIQQHRNEEPSLRRVLLHLLREELVEFFADWRHLICVAPNGAHFIISTVPSAYALG